MPNLDGTGPQGKGPKTGRAMGNCEGASKQGARGVGVARGRGMGRGRGFGVGQGRISADENKE